MKLPDATGVVQRPRGVSCQRVVAVVVELGHELAVGGAGGGEFVVAFFELQAQVDGLLLEVGDFLVERVDVGGRAEPGFAPGLFAERFGQPLSRVGGRGR